MEDEKVRGKLALETKMLVIRKMEAGEKHKLKLYVIMYGLGSSVGVATGYKLDGMGIESWWGRDFLHTSRPALPASCTMGTRFFLGVKWLGRGADHPAPLSAEVENE
jgi:hypothetical protein